MSLAFLTFIAVTDLSTEDIVVRSLMTDPTENDIAGFTEEKFLLIVGRALGNDFPFLRRHEIQELVDEEGRRKVHDSSSRKGNRLSTDRTSKRSCLSDSWKGDNFLQAGLAYRVTAVKQFGIMVGCIVSTQACTAGQEPFREVLIVDADPFYKSGRSHAHFKGKRLRSIQFWW
jgi:hypothetical protein